MAWQLLPGGPPPVVKVLVAVGVLAVVGAVLEPVVLAEVVAVRGLLVLVQQQGVLRREGAQGAFGGVNHSVNQ